MITRHADMALEEEEVAEEVLEEVVELDVENENRKSFINK
jgi:hypothetical protein